MNYGQKKSDYTSYDDINNDYYIDEEQRKVTIDEMLIEEEMSMYKRKLRELKLCEKTGINGEIMLYPKKEKVRKWYNKEYEAMVEQLYQVKDVDEYINVCFFYM